MSPGSVAIARELLRKIDAKLPSAIDDHSAGVIRRRRSGPACSPADEPAVVARSGPLLKGHGPVAGNHVCGPVAGLPGALA